MSVQSVFSGETVRLRALEAADAPALHDYLIRPELEGRRYLGWELHPWLPLRVGGVASAIERLVGGEKSTAFAVLRIDGEVVVGHATMNWGWDTHAPQMHLVIAPDQWRNGFGTDAARVLLRYLFGYTPAHVVQASYADWNEAAQHFAAALGYTEAGRERWAGLRDSRPYDEIMVDILRREWEEGDHAAGR